MEWQQIDHKQVKQNLKIYGPLACLRFSASQLLLWSVRLSLARRSPLHDRLQSEHNRFVVVHRFFSRRHASASVNPTHSLP